MCGFGISRQPRGAALIIVMLVMAVLLLAGTTFLTISSTESQIALNEQGYATAFVLAEAGIQKAIASLNDPFRGPAYLAKNGETNTAFGGGTFSVNLVTPSQRIQLLDRCPNDNSKDIIATASVPVRGGNAVVTLVVTVDQVTYPYSWATIAVVPNQIVSSLWDPMEGSWWDRTKSELLLRDTTTVDSFDSGAGPYDAVANSGQHGNVGANGDAVIGYNSTINGDVQAGDDIYMPSSVTVAGGPPTTGLSPKATDRGVPFPMVTTSGPSPTSGVSPQSYVNSGTGGLSVPAHRTVTLSAGTYYFTNISMGDHSTLLTTGAPVTIYVSGPPIGSTNSLANLGYNVTMGAQPGTQLQIIAKSDGPPTDFLTWVTQDGFRLYGSLYGKNTDIYLGYNSLVYGSVIGRTIRARSGSNIHFDQAMINQKLCHNDSTFYPRFPIRRGTWQEVIPHT